MSHGVAQLPIYTRAIRNGEIVPDADRLVSGSWTFGHVAGEYATTVAIDKAGTHGLSIVGIVEANHVGRLGHYVEVERP
jgi:LDH2 family malate/lactate/ureidoglycolate dehydrogenase